MTETSAPAPTTTATLLVERSSHPDYLVVTHVEMFVDGRSFGRKVTHLIDEAATAAHLAEVTGAAQRCGVDLTVTDTR
jgi:hypothetical protein